MIDKMLNIPDKSPSRSNICAMPIYTIKKNQRNEIHCTMDQKTYIILSI